MYQNIPVVVSLKFLLLLTCWWLDYPFGTIITIVVIFSGFERVVQAFIQRFFSLRSDRCHFHSIFGIIVVLMGVSSLPLLTRSSAFILQANDKIKQKRKRKENRGILHSLVIIFIDRNNYSRTILLLLTQHPSHRHHSHCCVLVLPLLLLLLLLILLLLLLSHG